MSIEDLIRQGRELADNPGTASDKEMYLFVRDALPALLDALEAAQRENERLKRMEDKLWAMENVLLLRDRYEAERDALRTENERLRRDVHALEDREAALRDPADVLREWDEILAIRAVGVPSTTLWNLGIELAAALRDTLAERDRLQEQRDQACRNQATAEIRLRLAEAVVEAAEQYRDRRNFAGDATLVLYTAIGAYRAATGRPT